MSTSPLNGALQPEDLRWTWNSNKRHLCWPYCNLLFFTLGTAPEQLCPQSKYDKNQWCSRVTHSLIEKSSSCCTYFSWLVIIWIIPFLGIKSLRGDFYRAVFAFLQDFPEIVNSISCCTEFLKQIKLCTPPPHAGSEMHNQLQGPPTCKSRLLKKTCHRKKWSFFGERKMKKLDWSSHGLPKSKGTPQNP